MYCDAYVTFTVRTALKLTRIVEDFSQLMGEKATGGNRIKSLF